MWFKYFLVSFVSILLQVRAKQLHILLIVVDDLGWSDVGFHGAKFKTPNMDKLAYDGVILDNYYVQPICSPTRSALMTGRYPIHTGLQRGVIRPDQPYGLPLNFITLPQKLKEAGYSTHLVGKWHLGFFKWPYTPTNRGFDSFYGLYTGTGDHFTRNNRGFLDLRDNEKPVKDKSGVYSARLFAEKAQNVILSHNASSPLFLYLSFQNVHGPLQAPKEYVDKYQNIKNSKRRRYAAMADIVDEAIGNVTQTMKEAGLWNDTLLIVSTDNGGTPKVGGYNWPLRGRKGSLWEGGIRGVGFVHGKMLKKTGVKCKELLHVTDWYPTLLYLAGIEENSTSPLDGFNIWHTISEGAASPRTEILHNINGPRNSGYLSHENGFAIRVGDMKLLMNVPNQPWYKPPELSVDATEVNELRRTCEPGFGLCYVNFQKTRRKIRVALYNITADPYELVDLSKNLKKMVDKLHKRAQFYMRGLVPPVDKPSDGRARIVAGKNGCWGPWKS